MDRLVSGGLGAKHTQTYGRYEARVRTEADPTGTTSGVLITWPADNNFPLNGENDYYETLAQTDDGFRDRREFYTFIHWPTQEGGNAAVITHDANATEWHHVVMEWSKQEIRIYLDGEFASSVTDQNAIPDVAHRMTIQLDAKNMNDMGNTKVRMYVDWIRAYERASC